MAIDKRTKDDIRARLQLLVAEARTHKDTVIEPKDRDRYRTYYGDPILYLEMFPRLSQNSSIVDTSVRQAVERQLAGLMKLYFGTDDVGTVTGRTGQDDVNAPYVQQLCNWQIIYKNSGYLKFYHWFKDALVILNGILKVTWHREVGEKEETQSIPSQAVQAVLEELANNSDIAVSKVEPDQRQPGNYLLTYTNKKAVLENYPVLENVPPSEFMYTPNARNKKDCNMFQRKRVTIDYLRRNIKTKQADGSYVGMYDKEAVDALVAGDADRGVDSPLDITIKDIPYYNEQEIHNLDDPTSKVEIVECYFKYDVNDDGLAEDVIATLCGHTLLRCDENEDGNPFCLISPIYDPHRIQPKYGQIDTMSQIQHLLTANMRLLVQNIAQNNSPQIAIQPDYFVDLDQVINGEEFWEIKGPIGEAFMPVNQPQVSPITLQFIELLKGWHEEASNVNRYNQGMDAGSLNKTATGIQALINQGAQSLELIGRNFAETGIKDLFLRLIYLNQKYIDHEQIVRLLDKDIVISPDNLKGDFDYMVNCGMGAGAKETDTQNMQYLIQMYPSLIPAGLANPLNAYNAMKKLLETMGIKNVDDFIQNPQQQQQKPPEGPKASESIRVDFASLPTNAKVQLLSMLGLQVTPQDFAVEQVNELQKTAAEETIKQGAKTHGEIQKQLATGNAGIGMPTIPQSPVQQYPPNMLETGREVANIGTGSPLPTQGNQVY